MFGLGPIGRWFAPRIDESADASAAGLDLTAADIEDLAAIGAEVEAEYGISSPAVLSATLTRLMRRQVPVRGIHPAEVRTLAGLQFADGTVVIVRGRHLGDLGRVAASIHFGSVHLDDFHAEHGRVLLDVSHGGHHDQLCALGITQPR